MKIAHVADIHWGLNYPGPDPSSRYEDITKTANWVAKRIIEEKGDMALVAGDLFKDANVFINRASKEITTAVNWLRMLTEHMPVVVISGTPSHDAVAAYEIIKEMHVRNLYVATTPQVITIDDVDIVCIPGMNRSNFAKSDDQKGKSAHEIHQAMTEAITQLCMGLKAKCSMPTWILMAHLTAEGADKGFDDLIMQHEPILKKEAMFGYDLVALGHIHRPQEISGAAYYPGSIERLSFNDEGIKTGFYIHNINELGVKSTFIETPARKFVTLNIETEAAIDISRGENCADVKDCIVRVKYECTDEQAKLIKANRIRQALYNAGAFYVAEIKPVITRTIRARSEEATADITPIKGLEIYCSLMGLKEVAELTAKAEGLLREVEA